LQDQSKTKAVVDYLNTNAKALFIDDVLGGEEIELKSMIRHATAARRT